MHRIGWVCFSALLAVALGCGAAPEGAAVPGRVVQVFKSPTCGCCAKWAEHLEASGFQVETQDVSDLRGVKQRYGVPKGSEECHTAVVDGYVIEGHVPASDVERLLEERPDVAGLVAPGMPMGSPGMESPNAKPFTVYAFDHSGKRSFFSRHE